MTLSPVAPTDSAYGIAPSNGHLLHFPRLFGLHSQVCYLWFGSIRIFTTAGNLRDECLNGEIFYSLKEAQIVIEKWRVSYNTKWPHSALGYRPPAPVVDGRGADLVGDEIAR